MYLIGRIKHILDLQKFKNNFKKKSIILITDEQYPQNIIVDFIQKKIDLLNYINKNDKVKVYINIKGREWINRDGVTKYFNSIQAWKIEKIKDDNDNYDYNNLNLNEDKNYINNDGMDLNFDDDGLDYNKKLKKNDKDNNNDDNDDDDYDDDNNDDDEDNDDDNDNDDNNNDEDNDDDNDNDDYDDDDNDDDEDNDDENDDDKNNNEDDDDDDDDNDDNDHNNNDHIKKRSNNDEYLPF